MKVRVDVSNIPGAGRGLFAIVDIKKGEEIMDVTGPRRSAADVETIHADNDYLLELNDGSGDCIEVMDDSRYANDAKGITVIKGLVNNAQFCSRDDESMYMEATRTIKAGQEIYVAYGAGYWHEFDAHVQARLEPATA
ncbi:MAG TPA: SET domain-containing protein-lysine N-methyltransferase [Chitinophagales bacterium]|nr:SET domain-containing protein-lysine N-methyltransferase [Chitinophagales bacterium]